jgi:molecular chaperone DnaJ
MGQMRDYYIILGVSRSESQEGIRAAFRKLAKKYHPDRCGSEGTRHFQEILEAYNILSDPEARRSYNQNLRNKLHVQTAATGPRRSKRAGRFSDYNSTRSSRYAQEEAFLSEIFESLANLQAEPFWLKPRKTLYIEVILTRDEAAQGGILPVPVPNLCSFCEGEGRWGSSICPKCSGQRFVQRGRKVRIQLPPDTKSGRVVEIPIGDPTAGVLILHIQFKVKRD